MSKKDKLSIVFLIVWWSTILANLLNPELSDFGFIIFVCSGIFFSLIWILRPSNLKDQSNSKHVK
jgi:hypothetical protein